ncbi:MAG TPA: transglutaminase N-terminal domain-containing protein, partial [Acidothermaceae bacterium]|nr:transglutaminase N-terminal domain-containing protein [Acidothermaceae bacterium]
MSWRLKIVHTTRFAYDSVAHASYNEARLTPPTLLTQTTLESRVEIEPAAPLYRYHDYWGTHVSAFDLDDEHSELVVTATSTVETTKHAPRPEPSITWLALQHPTTTDRFAEYLAQTTRTAVDDELVAEVREQVHDLSPNETALRIS